MDNPGPDHIFNSANLKRWKLEVGRVCKDTEQLGFTLFATLHTIRLIRACAFSLIAMSYLYIV